VPEVLELAAALKREYPARTLQWHFVNAGLTGTGGGETGVFGRFEAVRGNELWTGDPRTIQRPAVERRTCSR
jgi:putative transposase